MSDSDNDTKFSEELEKELETGLSNSSEESGSDDFTVRVRREEYIVKRRFYDKDKALETAESLRRDKRNLVEDNLEGQILSSGGDDDDDKVDWDKLVDAGLEFDPPIAQAAEKKPGEEPVGLADEIIRPEIDDRMLEKTLLVKRPKPHVITEEPDEDVAFEGEENEKGKGGEASLSTPGTTGGAKKGPLVFAAIVLILGLVAIVYLNQPSGDDQAEDPVPFTVTDETKKIMRSPQRPSDASVHTEPVALPASGVEKSEIKGPEATVDRETVAGPPEPATVTAPPAVPVSETVVPEILDHFTHTVHVSSYRDLTRANNAVLKLKKNGHDAFIGVVRIPDKGNWYRVYVGYLKSLDEAKSLAETIKINLREDTLARKTPWAIQVGTTASLAALQPLVSDLGKKGYAVTTVPVSRGSDMARILAGAFATEAEAATMVDLLVSDGFAAGVVLR